MTILDHAPPATAATSAADPTALAAYDRGVRPADVAVVEALRRAGAALDRLAASRSVGVWPHRWVLDSGLVHVNGSTVLAETAGRVARAFRAADGRPLSPVRAWSGPSCVVAAPGGGREGGGTVRTSDGVEYPVVAPYTVREGRRVFQVAGGGEPGWAVVGESHGLVATADLAGASTVTAGVLTNGAASQILGNRTARAHGLLSVLPTGGARLPRVSRTTAVGAPPPDTDRPPVTNPRNPAAARVQRGYGRAGLAVGLASGLALGREIDRRDVAVQQVVLERHADGRRRARVLRYRVLEGPPVRGIEQPFLLSTTVAWQGPDGAWVEEAAGKRAPTPVTRREPPMARQAPAVVE